MILQGYGSTSGLQYTVVSNGFKANAEALMLLLLYLLWVEGDLMYIP